MYGRKAKGNIKEGENEGVCVARTTFTSIARLSKQAGWTD